MFVYDGIEYISPVMNFIVKDDWSCECKLNKPQRGWVWEGKRRQAILPFTKHSEVVLSRF